MRIWVQNFSSAERNPYLHKALAEHLKSVVEPGVEIEVHGTRRGGLAEQFRFFQTIDTQDIIENILKCKNAKGEQKYDAFVTLNSIDPALYEAREILQIPVLGFLETTALVSCMMGRSFSLVTPNPNFSLSYSQKLQLYGLTERSTSIEAMNFPHLPDYQNAFIDPTARQSVLDEFDRVARHAVEAGAEGISPCGPVALVQLKTGVKEIDGALIMDALAVLMKMTEAAIKIQKITGTFVSRKLLYQMPGEVVREKAKTRYNIELD